MISSYRFGVRQSLTNIPKGHLDSLICSLFSDSQRELTCGFNPAKGELAVGQLATRAGSAHNENKSFVARRSYDMYCLKRSELSWEYLAAMRIMDNAPRLSVLEVVEIVLRVTEARKAVSEHRKTCIFCNPTTSQN